MPQWRGRLDSLTVAGDCEADRTVPGRKRDPGLGDLGVSGKVGHGLLRDAKDLRFDALVKAGRAVGLQVGGGTEALGETGGEPTECGVESEIIENAEAHQPGEFALFRDVSSTGCRDSGRMAANWLSSARWSIFRRLPREWPSVSCPS
jgi:hypothetical protein